jgi:hypothetical protein
MVIKKLLHAVSIIWIVTLFGGKLGEAKDRIFGSSLSTCDAGLALDSADPLDAAKAIDICKTSDDPEDWGLVSAAWVMADGSTAVSNPTYAKGHGIFDSFGSNVTVRNGDRLLALSTGFARRPMDLGWVEPITGTFKGYTGNNPAGFPKATTTCLGTCPLTGTPHDDAALAVTLRVPWFANGFSFDYKYYTSNYPNYICSQYVDWFVAILDPIPEGQTDGNIAFDSYGYPIGNNNALLQFCTPNSAAGCYSCERGTAELQGTGYENYAGSQWLTATAPAEKNTVITLRFAIYDSGDGTYDSIVLIDNFRWSVSLSDLWLPLIMR